MRKRIKCLFSAILIGTLMIANNPVVMAEEGDDVQESSSQEDAVGTYVFYDADQSTELTRQKVRKGDVLYAPATPEKEGYFFLGWTTEPDSSTVELESFETMVVSDQTDGTVISYYPVFEEKLFVYFMHPDGYVLQTEEGIHGDQFTTSDVTFRVDAERKVIGWYLEEECINKVELLTLEDHNVTLYPKVAKGNTITFDRAEGATYFEPQFVDADEVSVDPGIPERMGYSFHGWSTTEGSDTADFTFGEKLEDSITLYAVWKLEKATFSICIMIQSDQDNKNTVNKTYIEAETKLSAEEAVTESIVNSADYEGEVYEMGYIRNSSMDKEYQIKGDGSTTVYVYYDRILITYEVWQAATDNEGVQYGEEGPLSNTFFPITYKVDRRGRGRWEREDGRTYTGNRYRPKVVMTGLYQT